MPEWLNPDLIIWIATVVLGVLGVKNAAPILAFIKGLLPKSDGKKDDSSVLPWFDDEPRPMEYDLVDAYAVLANHADEQGNKECRCALDEAIGQLITGRKKEAADAKG